MHSNLTPDQIVQVLIAGLQERYAASHKMRERGLRFSLWLSGFALGLSWLLVCGQSLAWSQKIALTALIAVMVVGAFSFLWSLEKGFQNNRAAMVRFERALGMHRPGAYLENEPLLPKGYAGTSRKWNGHFPTLVIWLLVVALSLLVLTWAGPGKIGAASNQPSTEQTLVKGGKGNG